MTMLLVAFYFLLFIGLEIPYFQNYLKNVTYIFLKFNHSDDFNCYELLSLSKLLWSNECYVLLKTSSFHSYIGNGE